MKEVVVNERKRIVRVSPCIDYWFIENYGQAPLWGQISGQELFSFTKRKGRGTQTGFMNEPLGLWLSPQALYSYPLPPHHPYLLSCMLIHRLPYQTATLPSDAISLCLYLDSLTLPFRGKATSPDQTTKIYYLHLNKDRRWGCKFGGERKKEDLAFQAIPSFSSHSFGLLPLVVFFRIILLYLSHKFWISC